MSNRPKGKALAQNDPYRKPKKNRHMIPKRVTNQNTSAKPRRKLYGSGIILACLIGLVFWIVAWLAFC